MLDELQPAPEIIRQILETIPRECLERAEINEEVESLANAYLAMGVLPKSSQADALHIAIVTVSRAGLVFSWNFKHIVNYRRIQKFNGAQYRSGLWTD